MKRTGCVWTLTLWLALAPGLSAQDSPQSPEAAEAIRGSVTIPETAKLPVGSTVHVVLSEVRPGRSPIALGEFSAPATEFTGNFDLYYFASDIRRDAEYAVHACVEAEGRLWLVTEESKRVVIGDQSDKVRLLLAPLPTQTSLPDVAGEQMAPEDVSPLIRAVAATLAGRCHTVGPGYDRIFRAQAHEILPPELLSGPHHRVRNAVSVRGPQYFFTVQSDFGEFQALGSSRLRRLVREINALASMREATSSATFKDAFVDSVADPFQAAKELIVDPVETVSGIPKGLWTFVEAGVAGMSQGRSVYEDSYLEALATVSKYKREYAADLQIDVYTSTPQVQEELNRLGWAAAVGNWTPAIALAPLSGPGKAAYRALDWTETLNRIITEAAPDTLRHENGKLLEQMGVSQELRNEFLGHAFYSPRNQTVITRYLAEMENASGREAVIEQATKARSEIDAFNYQQIIEVLAAYNRSQSPIIALTLHKGIPVGYAENEALVMGFPVDIGRWTPFSEYLFKDFGAEEASGRGLNKRELWITGELTPKAALRLDELGIQVQEGVAEKIGLMDW